MKKSLILSNVPRSLEEAKVLTKQALGRESIEISELVGDRFRVLQLRVPLVSLNLSSWVSSQSIFPKVFWKRREGPRQVTVGVGCAFGLSAKTDDDRLRVWAQMQEIMSFAEDLSFFVGSGFPSMAKSAEWKGYGIMRCLVPRVVIAETAHGLQWVYSLVLQHGEAFSLENLYDEIDSLIYSEEFPQSTGVVLSRVDVPHFEDWNKVVGQALKAIGQHRLSKVVLSRRTTVALQEPADPMILLDHLLRESKDGFAYLFQVDENHGFLGLSPELLCERLGRNMRTEALAGTRPRSQDVIEDERFTNELLSSEKEIREHGHVVEMVSNVLEGLCDSYAIDDTERILKLKNQQHLLLKFKGLLHKDVLDRDMCEALHPTPAVGGAPKDEAIKFIHQKRFFDRGWFTGFFGTLSNKHLEMTVMIRSCLVDQSMLHFFAGAGLVEGSSAALEWDEMNAKIKTYLDILYGRK